MYNIQGTFYHYIQQECIVTQNMNIQTILLYRYANPIIIYDGMQNGQPTR